MWQACECLDLAGCRRSASQSDIFGKIGTAAAMQFLGMTLVSGNSWDAVRGRHSNCQSYVIGMLLKVPPVCPSLFFRWDSSFERDWSRGSASC